MSDPVTLSVSEKPKPELTSSLKGAVLTGNSVTLYCTLKPQSAGWKFYWSKPKSSETETESDSNTISSVRVSDRESPKPVVIIKTDPQVFSGETVTFRCNIQSRKYTEWAYIWNKKDYTEKPYKEIQEFNISVTVSDSGTYTCRGRSSDSQHSKDSDPFTLTVSEKPKPELTSDLKAAALTGTSVTLSCTLKPHSAGWKFYWSKPTQSSETETETHHYFISSVRVYDGDGDVILDSPVHPVTEGHPLNLRCLYRSKMIPDSGIDFYKDDSILQNQTTGEMTISSVSKSDEGFYHCKHPERGESPKSWVSVRVSASRSTGVIIGLSLASVFVILMILLILLLHFKKKKGNVLTCSLLHCWEGVQSQSPTLNQDTNQPTDGENVYGNTAIITTGDSAVGSSNTIYSQVMARKKKQNDTDAESGDVTYAEIDLKKTKKTKRNQGLSK
ncbi:hypothetical protein QTP70_001750 [Hemibagrus guttatus]|uniref:Ig-like domain-containing protein n=1 Tax=Hemibagrus guttatus TaxID=175788 RepID=A0AAE0VAE7_9TELE|nr:hypothetical protein QTP70_001750 [Hemibagrus guttatus]